MREHKKQKIEIAAIDLFASYGIRNVPLERIAETLEISRGQIYYYFKGGKRDIIASILQTFEDLVTSGFPNPNEWDTNKANASYILSKLFFKFPDSEARKYRKIIRIILSEMFYYEQIKRYVEKRFIVGREDMLALCFDTLAKSNKINSFPADSAARFINRLLVVYAILDALRYSNDTNKLYKEFELMERDCMNFFNLILS